MGSTATTLGVFRVGSTVGGASGGGQFRRPRTTTARCRAVKSCRTLTFTLLASQLDVTEPEVIYRGRPWPLGPIAWPPRTIRRPFWPKYHKKIAVPNLSKIGILEKRHVSFKDFRLSFFRPHFRPTLTANISGRVRHRELKFAGKVDVPQYYRSP